MGRRTVIVGLLVALAVAIGWVLHSGPAEGSGDATGEIPRQDALAETHGGGAADRIPATGAGETRVELEPGGERVRAPLGWEKGIPAFRGKLLLPDGRPAGEAQVNAFGLDGWSLFFDPEDPATDVRVAWETTTRADGGFHLPEAPQDGLRFLLRARAPGLPPLEILNLPAAPGRTRDLGELRLLTGFRIRGRVLDPDGVPVPGAEVVPVVEPDGFTSGPLRRGSWPALAGYRATTDGSGTFELTALPPGRLRLRASVPGFASSESAPAEGTAGALLEDFEVVMERATSLAGKVVGPTREPVEGARLRLELGDRQALETRADASGDFRFSPPAEAGLLVLRIAAPGYRPVRMSLGPEDTRMPVEIRLATLPPLEGAVSDDAGRALGGAFVRLVELGHSRDLDRDPGGLPALAAARTDSSGAFRLEPDLSATWERRFRVVAWTEEHGPAWSAVLSFTAAELAEAPAPLRLQLVPGARVSGQVLDPWSQPRDGVRVFLRQLANERSVSRRAPLAPSSRRRGSLYRSASTAADGSFRFAGIPFGDYRLEAHLPGFSPARSDDFAVGPEPVERALQLHTSAKLVGEVLGDRSWFPDIRASAFASGEDPVDVIVDEDGRFRFTDLSPGLYTVVLRELDPSFAGRVFLLGSGEGLARADGIDVRAGETARVVLRIDLSNLGAVQGRVLMNGRAAAEMNVFVVPMDLVSSQDPRLGWRTLARRLRSAITDREGRYRIGALDPDDYWVVVERSRAWPEGVFRLPGDGSAWAGPTGLARAEVELPPGGVTQQDFGLRVGGLEGTVMRRDEAGRSVPLRSGAVLLVPGPDLPGVAARRVDLERGGRFRVQQLAAGDWLLTARGGSATAAEIPVAVAAGVMTEVEAVLGAVPHEPGPSPR